MIWYYIAIGLAVALTVILVIWAFSGLHWEVPDDERGYLDPLPPLLRFIWPLTRFVAYYAGGRMPAPWLESAHRKLARSGANYMMNAEEFYAIRFIAATAAFVLIWLGTRPLGSTGLFLATMVGILGFVYPVMWLNGRYNSRKKDILKALPMFLDYIVLAVEAGTNFSGALAQTVEKGPVGPMRQEFFLVLRDLRAGLSRADALRRMDDRLKIPEVSSVVSSIIQAEQVGASIGKILRMQAERRRMERFQRAEKLAMEAPVKLMLPLVLFIFPTTFIVLAFPIVMMIKQQGLL